MWSTATGWKRQCREARRIAAPQEAFRPPGFRPSGLKVTVAVARGRARSAPPPPPWPELHPRPTPLASRASGRRAPGQGQGQTFGRWASSGSGRGGARLRADSAGGWLGWEKARDSPDQGVWGGLMGDWHVWGASASAPARCSARGRAACHPSAGVMGDGGVALERRLVLRSFLHTRLVCSESRLGALG